MSATFAAGTLAITGSTAPGGVELEWSGTPSEQIALVSLDLDNGRHIVLPLLVSFQTPCSAPAHCDLHGSADADSALACAGASAPATCQPESPCSAGPQCGGGLCCGKGEQCVNGTCLCGSGTRCSNGECAAGSLGPCGIQCCGGNTNVNCDF